MGQSYIVKTKYKITRQAGDTGEIVFIVPEAISLTTMDVLFQVRDDRGKLLFEKKTEDSEITIIDQEITILLENEDTALKHGEYNWELELHNTTEVSTIAKGQFILIEEIAI